MSAVDRLYDELDIVFISQKIRSAVSAEGGRYATGFYGPDHTGRVVQDMNFQFGDKLLQVTVKEIEVHLKAAD